MVKKKEDKFDKLARLIKQESEDIRTELKTELGGKIDKLEKKVEEGFARMDRRFDTMIQPQLDAHAGRIKTLETKVFPR